MKLLILSLALGVTMPGKAVLAHHSIAAVYDSSREVAVEGVVTQFHFVNPHPFVSMEVKDGGATHRWRLEMDNRSELAEIGFTVDTFKPGDRIVVAGSPARKEPHSLYIRRLDRPVDGLRYEQVGSSPRLRAPTR